MKQSTTKSSDPLPFFAACGGLAVGLAVWAEKITLPSAIMSGLRALAEKTPFAPLEAGAAVMAGLITTVVLLLVLELFRFRILVHVGRFRQNLAEKTLKKPAVADEYSRTTETLKKLYK